MAMVLAEQLGRQIERDSHGNVQLSGSGILGDFLGDLIKGKLGIKRVRSDTFGYLQRSFPGFVSKVDATEARLVGKMAVKYSARKVDGSVAMRRVEGGEYKIETFLTPLHTVARETKHLPPEFMENGNNITQAFVDYARPLVGELPPVGSFEELK